MALKGSDTLYANDTIIFHVNHNLGRLNYTQEKLEDAEEQFKKALVGKTEEWGILHPSTLETVENLGNVYAAQGHVDAAVEMALR